MKISDADKEYLLSLKPDDLTFSTLVSIFGDTTSQNTHEHKKSRFNTWDTLTLSPSEYNVKEKTETTVGRLIFNKYLIERFDLFPITGYINETLTQGGFRKFENTLDNALIDDRMTLQQYISYINYRDTIGMQLNSVITSSFTEKTVKIDPKIKQYRDQLFKKYDKELASGDIVLSEKLEKELTKISKDALKGDPGMELYNSGARGNIGNYKNMNLFKGASMNTQTGKYEIVRSSYMDGIRKEDIPSFATSVVAGAYPKSVGTAESGYLAKQLLAAMQQEQLGDKGSDCGVKKTIEIVLTPRDVNDFKYRYIVENGKLVCLKSDIINKYIGKTIHLRSPMYCKNDKICNICGGDMNYILGATNIGLGCSQIATKFVRLGMKKFHTSAISSQPIDIEDLLI